MAPSRSVTVYGAGAVGGYLGARLAAANPALDITLLGRRELAAAVRREGLILRDQGGGGITHPIVATSTAGLPEQDLILLTVRTYDVAAALGDVGRLMGQSGTVIAFQNGVGSEEELANALGRRRVLAGTLTASVGMPRPGIVERFSRSGGVALASMDGSNVPAWIVDLFTAPHLPVTIPSDYRALRWSKLLLNLLGAATSAILDMDPPELLADPLIFRCEQLGLREAGRVMDKLGVQTIALPGYSVPLLRLAMRLPRPLAQRLLSARASGARGGQSPTMRADLERQRSEIGWLHGAVADTGRRVGVATPINAALRDLVLQLVAHPEEREHYRRRPEALIGYLRARGARL